MSTCAVSLVTDLAHEAPRILCALISLGGLIFYLGHHDSFQLGLIYPSEGASTTPKSLGFIRPQKVSKIADVLQLEA